MSQNITTYKSACDLEALEKGQLVMFKQFPNANWKRETRSGTQTGSDRSCIVSDRKGDQYRRNRLHIRPAANPGEDVTTHCNFVVTGFSLLSHAKSFYLLHSAVSPDVISN